MANNFKTTYSIELKPEINQADLRNAVGQIRALVEKMNINARVLSGTAGGVRLDFGKGVSPQQRGAVTGLANDVLGLKKAAQQTGDEVGRLDTRIKRNVLTMAMFAVGWQIAYGSINAVKQLMSDMVRTSADFEEALARIRIVTLGVTEDYDKFGKELLNIGTEFGMSAKDAAEGAMLWAQQGRTLAESLELTRIAAIGVNITGLSMTTVVEGMSSVMRAFNMDAGTSIVILDKLVQVANVTDIGMGDLLEGIKRVGSTSNIVGITLDELSSMIGTIANTTHQAAGEIGNALRTIFMREGRTEVREFINNIVGIPIYMNNMGEATRQQTGRMRSFTAILRDVAKEFKNMSTENKLMLVDQLAAIRQGDKLIALLKNWDTFERILTKSQQSEGLALKSNEIIMGLFNKQVAILRAEYDKLAISIGSSAILPFLTKVVHGIQTFVQWIEQAVKALGKFSEILLLIIPTLGAALAVWGGPVAWIGYFIVAISGLSLAFAGLGSAAAKAGEDMRKFEMQVSSMSMRSTRNELNNARARIKEIQDDIKARFKNLDNIKKYGQIRNGVIDVMTGLPLGEKDIMQTKIDIAKQTADEIRQLKHKEVILDKHLKSLIKQDHKQREAAKAAQAADEAAIRLDDIKKGQAESTRHYTEMARIGGMNALELKKLEYQLYLQTSDALTNNVKKQQYLNEIQEEYTKELYKQADAYKQIVSEGINKIIEGTATLQDMGKELLDSARKSIIEDVVGIFGEQTGIFNLMSAATKSPIAQAHLNGISAGSKMIINAHIAGIKAGMSGQSSAQAIANMQSGGSGGSVSSIASMFSNNSQAQGNNYLSGIFGGAAWTQNNNSRMPTGASSTYYPGQKGPNSGTYGNKNWMGGAALSGALVGISQYSTMRSSGAGAAASIAGGLMTGIGTMALMAPDPTGITQLGGAVLLGLGLLTQSFTGKKSQTTTEVKEQTHQVTSRINVTNKQLEVVNRNLVALRRGFEGWVMMESYYLRSRSRNGVNVQNEFALNMRRGAQV